MRIVFLGTPDFAVPALAGLHEAGHELVLVVTNPDAARGRGLRPAAPAVKIAGLQLGLEVYQPENVNRRAAVKRLMETAPDLGVVVAFGAILRPKALAVAAQGFLNVHASLLPSYRGSAPINWAIIRGERETGVTIQRMATRMDAGPILAQKRTVIGENETAGELHDRLCTLGAEALVDVVNRIAAGERMPETPQDEALVTMAPKLAKADGRVDWALSAVEIHDLVRGLTPWPGAWSFLLAGGRREKIGLIETAVRTEEPVAGRAGDVLTADDRDGIVVRAGRGSVLISKLKPASGRAMSAGDYMHGHKVAPGDRFE